MQTGDGDLFVLAQFRKATLHCRTEPTQTSFTCQGVPLRTFPSQWLLLLQEDARMTSLFHGSPDFQIVGFWRARSWPAAAAPCITPSTLETPKGFCWLELQRIWLLLTERQDASISLPQLPICKMGTIIVPPSQDCPEDYIWHGYKAYSTSSGPTGCSVTDSRCC